MSEIIGNKSPTSKIKRKVIKALLNIVNAIYCIATAIVPIYVFINVYSTKSLPYSVAIAFISIIIMDIICCIFESCLKQISKSIKKSKKKKQKKQEEMKEKREKDLQQILTEKENYIKEIELEEKEYQKSKKEIEGVKQKLDNQTYTQLCAIYDKVENIMKRLKEETEEYYQIRDKFNMHFTAFRKTTWQYINIVKAEAADEENKMQYKKLIKKFDNYLQSIKSKLDIADKKKLNAKMKSLIKEMDTERKKGE